MTKCKICGEGYAHIVDHYCGGKKAEKDCHPASSPYWNCPKCGVMFHTGGPAESHYCGPIPSSPEVDPNELRRTASSDPCVRHGHRPGRWKPLPGGKLQGRECTECGLITVTATIPEAK